MGSGKPEEASGRSIETTLFVSDPSAEAERISGTLRSHGYTVVDVPLSMLVARVAVQRPRVILLDADGDGALASVARMRELPDSESIDVVFLGRAGAALADAEDALAHEGSGFFARPIDVPALLRKIEALTGRPSPAATAASPAPPASPALRPSAPPSPHHSLPPPSMRHDAPATVLPRALGSLPRIAPPPPSLPSLGADPGKRGIQAQVSNELEQLLADAEQRASGQMAHESVFPSPDEELEAVLPADVLASLDEPIDAGDADDGSEHAVAAHAKGTTSSGGSRLTTGLGQQRPSGPPRPGTDPPGGAKTHSGTHVGSTTGARAFTDFQAAGPTRGESLAAIDRPRLGTLPPSTTYTAPPQFERPRMLSARSESPELPMPRSSGPVEAMALGLGLGPAVPMPSVLAPGDAARALAHAITSRATGALCFESQDGMRRAVLREGDLVTAASGVDSETLLAFLVGRGDLARDQVEKLVGRLPPFGRHAGAALVAHGHLRQDQLWPVLRAHAEWVLGRAIQLPTGTATLEPEAPGRLRAEPSVFGGSTGAEIFVEVVRRVVSPDEATNKLGGSSTHIGDGRNARLLGESGLDSGLADRLTASRGTSIQALLGRSPEGDIAAVLYALNLLGVFEMIRGGSERHLPTSASDPAVDALDEEAVRARVHARLQLVEEGDYFSLLGISRDATGYEVRRAFLELRRTFEPSRILTPQIADLSQDIRKIAVVLDEAYEILRDQARRERYRRAIDGSPRA